MAEPSPSTDPQADRPTFDVAVVNRLRDAFLDIFLHHPEVKGLAASVTWNGNLNDAQITHGIWLGNDGGPVTTPAGIIGSTYQTLKLLDEQLGRAMSLLEHTRDQYQVLATELVDKQEAINKCNEELKKQEQALAGYVRPREATYTGPG